MRFWKTPVLRTVPGVLRVLVTTQSRLAVGKDLHDVAPAASLGGVSP